MEARWQVTGGLSGATQFLFLQLYNLEAFPKTAN